jgi:collagenase-like PrtC family protease
MESKLYIIYMPRVAAALRELGFKIIKVSPNQKKPQYDVYWFEDTTQFREAIPKAVEMARK